MAQISIKNIHFNIIERNIYGFNPFNVKTIKKLDNCKNIREKF